MSKTLMSMARSSSPLLSAAYLQPSGRMEMRTQANPAAKFDTFRRRETDRAERRPFTVKELTNILANASGEWKGIILFGLYTGQRLKDFARRTWQNIDTEHDELRFVTAKTGRRMSLPLASPLLAHVQT